MVSTAVRDVSEGMRYWHLWSLMGWQDIKFRYRRSMLGPFWLTISMGVMVTALGFLYGNLFKVPLRDYLPFLALGLLVWNLISAFIADGCEALASVEGIIKEVRLPYSLHVYRMVWRNVIIFAHNLVVYVAVAAYFRIHLSWATALAVPGIFLLIMTAVPVGIVCAMVCARFRDVPQIVASLLQVMFFLTPIIWKPELLHDRPLFVQFNPFFHFVEIVRAPLLGHAVPATTWLYVSTCLVVSWCLAVIILGRYRKFVAYWI